MGWAALPADPSLARHARHAGGRGCPWRRAPDAFPRLPPRPRVHRPQVKLASYETYGGPAEVRSVVATVYNAGYTGAIDDVQDDIALMLLNKPSSVRPVSIAPGEGGAGARACAGLGSPPAEDCWAACRHSPPWCHVGLLALTYGALPTSAA